VGDVISYPDDPRPATWRRPIVALGNFDGLHRGHQKIVERVCRQAREQGATAVVMTFDPHPPRIVRPDKAPPLLMTNAQRVEALRKAGVDGVAFVRFTHEMSQWEPEHFVKDVIAGWLHPAEVWVGGNFLFGRNRSGNFSLLRSLGLRYGFRAEQIDPVRYRDFVVSSTRVRRLITEARVDEAAALLGHYHFIAGTVVAGPGGAARSASHRQPDDRERAAAAAGRLRHCGHHRPHRPSRRHQHRRPPDLRDGRRGDDRDPHFRA
jgi:riboflavin kinase/FMN adenylyltransferase